MSGQQLRDAGSRRSGDDEVNLFAVQTPLHVGRVSLVVRDLERVGDFYQKILGLGLIDRTPDQIRLGAGATVLLELRSDPAAAPGHPRTAGLFHTAFLLPTRRDLAQWLLHAANAGARLQGASDHLVSEAIYLADPEGNGIEVYRDRAPGEWRRNADGIVVATEALDLDALVSIVAEPRWSGMPEGSCVGHVHLRVGDIPKAEAFYRDALGMPLVTRYPGGSFFGSGGYHHHIAANIWSSRGAGPRERPSAGLDWLELIAADDEAFSAAKAGLANVATTAASDGALIVDDPWLNRIVLRKA
jgi:catechol 2,3-dioxygenase